MKLSLCWISARSFLFASSVFCATAAAAAWYDENNWRKDSVTGEASGSVTNDAHWTKGADSTLGQWIAPLAAADAADYTVSFPAGYVAPGSGLNLGVADNQTLHLSGGDYLTTDASSERGWVAFSLHHFNNNSCSRMSWIEYPSDATRLSGGLNWFDIDATVSVTNSGIYADFTGGDLTATNSSAKTVFFYYPSTLKESVITFRNGANLRLKTSDCQLWSGFETNRLVFVGGDHLMGTDWGSLWFKDADSRIIDGKDVYSELRLSEGAKLVTSGFHLGGYVGNTQEERRLGFNKRRRLIVEGGSTLVDRANDSFYTMDVGDSEILVMGPGSRMEFAAYSLPMLSSERGRSQAVASRLIVTDGGYVRKHGSAYALSLGVDGRYGDIADCPSVIALTNGTLVVDSTMSIYSGDVRGDHSTITNNVLRLGYTSYLSTIDLTGGELMLIGEWDGSISGIGYTGVGILTASEGAKILSERRKVWIGQEAGSDGTLVLKSGATFVGNEIVGGSGTSSLVADGGILRPTSAAANLLHGLTSAKLTAKGLTVESDNAVTIAQSFGNAPDENGVLTLRGTGVKTLSGTATDVNRIAVLEGSLVFADAARCASTVVVTNGASVAFCGSALDGTLKGLVLGDAESAATLVLAPNKKIAVDGPVALDHLRLVLESGFAQGTYTILEATGSVSEATRMAWQNTLVISGVPNGCVPTFASEEVSGTTVFTMTLAPAVERRITVTAGTTQTVATVEHYGANETLTVDVQEGAAANVTAALGAGNFVKEGRGVLTLASTENGFLGRLSTFGGLFAVPNLLSLGFERFGLGTFTLGAGTLQLGASGADEQRFEPQLVVETPAEAIPGVVVKTDSDIVMAAPTMERGAILKRGAGRLTLEVAGETALTVTNAYASYNSGARTTVMAFDEAGNVPTGADAWYTGFNVLEGETVIRGTVSGARVTTAHHVAVGLSPTTGTANPGFVVDNATFVNSGDGIRFHFADGISASNPFAESPYLYVTNNATFEVGSLMVCCNSDTRWPRLTPRILVDHSVFKIGDMRVSGDWHYPEWTFRNDARFYSVQLYASARRANFVFDASICAKNADLDPLEYYDSYSYYERDATFRNGSLFCCDRMWSNAGAASCTNFWNFDDSEWRPVKSGDFAFSFPNAWNQLVRVTGKGLILAPPAGATWRMPLKVTGAGGLVKRGAGTLVFDTNEAHGEKVADDPVTLDCTGTIAVEGGTLRVLPDTPRAGLSFDVASGATLDFATAALANVTVTGAGTVTGGTLEGLTIVPGDNAGTVFESAALGGVVTVDFARASEDPIAPGTYVVARYTGAAPSLAGWKAKGFGRRGLMAEFTAWDGIITAKVVEKGLMLIVR